MTTDMLGRHLNGLQLIRLIGRGATASVYLASDGRLIRAVKVFPASSRDRAERELKFGALLDHTNLNTVERLLELDGCPALVMPYVKGELLSDWFRANDRPALVVGVLAQVAGALAHLAELGLVHRDLKPENVIVDGEGRVTLLDYDLGIRVGEAPDHARITGTPAFASPEQVAGLPVSPASDLYSLGVLAWWGLCREAPFTGPPAEVLKAHLEEIPRRVSELRPEAAPLDGLVAALLAKDPLQRPGHDEVLRCLSPSSGRLDG